MWLARIVIGIYCFAVASAVTGEVWNEVGDARSFPDAAAQVTRGAGELTTIVGATSGSDLRDAFCIKIVDPSSFRATTDPGTAPGAGASFDTRLFLFDEYGAPVLANDDASSSGGAFASALSGAATDGSGVALSRPGEYVLLVSGSLESPWDSAGRHLFAIGSGRGLTHAADPRAGRFDRWEADRRESGAAATGSYTAVLAGANFCQGAPDDGLDVVLGSAGGPERVCLGDGSGGFQTCADLGVDVAGAADTAAGFVDGDAHLDVVFSGGSFGGGGAPNVLCLGNGAGGFSGCQDVSLDDAHTRGVALGFVDGDSNLDAVFANDVFGGQANNRVCLGDGSGGFTSCADVSEDGDRTAAVALGLLDGDANLDAVFANSGPQGQLNRVCLGNGDGTFQPCEEVGSDEDGASSLVLGQFGDPDIFADGFESGDTSAWAVTVP